MGLLAAVVNVFVDEDGDHGNPLGIVWSSPYTRGCEQQIAADLGFSETIFIDEVSADAARARIFTPATELRFAGHPTVGLAAWLREAGDDIRTILLPAGESRVRIDDDRIFINAFASWTPDFDFEQLDTPAEVDAVDPLAYGDGLHYVWAWISEDAGTVRARMFAPDLGIREDEATGAGAIGLTARLGRDLDITQGQGSRLYTHSRYLGQQIEVGGRTSSERIIELG